MKQLLPCLIIRAQHNQSQFPNLLCLSYLDPSVCFVGWKVCHRAVWMGWLMHKRDTLEGSLCYQLQPGAESPVCPSDRNQCGVLFVTAWPDKLLLSHLTSRDSLSALSLCNSICWSPPSAKGERLWSIAVGKYQYNAWHCMDLFIVDL